LLEENKLKSLQSHESAEDSVDISPDAADRLHYSSKTLGLPRSSMILLALYRYLTRATCSEDITFGVVLFGRTQPQLDPSRFAGPCINILPMRIDRQQTTLALLKTIRQRLAGLQLHDQMSSKVAKAAAGLSLIKPLFNTIINYRRHHYANGQKHFHLRQSLVRKGPHPQAFLISKNYPILFTVDEVDNQNLRVSVRCPSCLDPRILADELCKELVKTLAQL
jgi:non-ribosomal peptide synthetase component F